MAGLRRGARQVAAVRRRRGTTSVRRYSVVLLLLCAAWTAACVSALAGDSVVPGTLATGAASGRALASTVVLVAPTPAQGSVGSGVDAVGCGTGVNAPCATIQYAVDACPAGGTVQLLPGRHTASGNSSATCPAYSQSNAASFFPGIRTGGKAITIMSDPPQSATVDAQLCGRAFLFDGGETSATVLQDIRVRAAPLSTSVHHVTPCGRCNV